MISDLIHRLDLIDTRFWARARKEPNGCWMWTRATNQRYGVAYMTYNGKKCRIYAHRLAFLLSRGHLNDDLMVLHSCDHPLCCRPDHLFQGTGGDNVKDMWAKGRASLKRAKGDLHSQAKLTSGDVIEMRDVYATGTTTYELAARYGVSRHAITLALTGETWAHVDDVPTQSLRRGNVKLTDAHVLEIRAAYDAGESPRAIAARYRVHTNNVSLIVNGHTWTHLPLCKNRDAVNARNRRPMAKLTDAHVREIRARYAAGERATEVGVSYGLSRSASHAVATGRTYTHVS